MKKAPRGGAGPSFAIVTLCSGAYPCTKRP